MSGLVFSLGLSLRTGSGLRPIRASDDSFPSQNVLVPFFRLRLCSLGLSDPRRRRYSGLDPETEAQKDHIAVFIITFILFNIASNQAADLKCCAICSKCFVPVVESPQNDFLKPFAQNHFLKPFAHFSVQLSTWILYLCFKSLHFSWFS